MRLQGTSGASGSRLGRELGDAGVFVLGMVAGAAVAHIVALTGRPDSVATGTVGGVGPYGMAAVVLGLLVCGVIGFTMREKT